MRRTFKTIHELRAGLRSPPTRNDLQRRYTLPKHQSGGSARFNGEGAPPRGVPPRPEGSS